MRHPIVVVEWGDAWIDTDDVTPKKASKLKPVGRKTVGFFLAQNKHGDIILCTDLYDKKSDGASAPMLIPAGMVKRWYELEF